MHFRRGGGDNWNHFQDNCDGGSGSRGLYFQFGGIRDGLQQKSDAENRSFVRVPQSVARRFADVDRITRPSSD
jgi:hypothetical protein